MADPILPATLTESEWKEIPENIWNIPEVAWLTSGNRHMLRLCSSSHEFKGNPNLLLTFSILVQEEKERAAEWFSYFGSAAGCQAA